MRHTKKSSGEILERLSYKMKKKEIRVVTRDLVLGWGSIDIKGVVIGQLANLNMNCRLDSNIMVGV